MAKPGTWIGVFMLAPLIYVSLFPSFHRPRRKTAHIASDLWDLAALCYPARLIPGNELPDSLLAECRVYLKDDVSNTSLAERNGASYDIRYLF